MQLTVGDHLYACAARVAFPGVWLVARLLGVPGQQLRWRRGELPRAPGPLVWFHGASAGEMAAATHLVAVLRQHGLRFTAAFTAANTAGIEFVSRHHGSGTLSALAPWDHPRWVRRAFDRWQPAALLLVETELWPQLILEACRRGIPVFCVSARVYPRDVARYRLVRGYMRQVLGRLSLVVAQDKTERERFVSLGAPEDRCVVGGNLKYLAPEGIRPPDKHLRNAFGLGDGDRTVVFGSLHADEIGVVFDALERLRSAAVRVIIAPRHASCCRVVARQAQRRNWRLEWWSAGPARRDWQVLVLDRMGDLSRAYAVACVGVVGGGFGPHGGHNLMEPLLAGTPVLFGPHFEHFEGEARALTLATPSARVAGASELAARLAEWLGDAARQQAVYDLQREVLPDGTAMAARYVAAIAPSLAALTTER
jgi:3-deoxy-D-manno-octulosonic-acid transferase